MDGKSQAWRDAANDLLIALAKENKYIVSDMVILFLQSAGYGIDDYSALGGVFRRAAKAGIIKKIPAPRKAKQSLWASTIYTTPKLEASTTPALVKGQIVPFRNFGDVEPFSCIVTDIKDNGEIIMEVVT